MVDHHRHDRVRGEPTLLRRRQRHPGLVEAQAPPGAPAAQQFVAVAPANMRQGAIDEREQRFVTWPEQETETLAVDGCEVLDAQVQQVMGLDEVVRGNCVPQHAIDIPHAQRFQGKLRRVEPDDPAVRIGSFDTFGGKIALDRGQPGLRLRIERGTAGRHQYRPVGKIRSGCQQAVLSGLDLATDAKQVDLPLRQRVDCRLPRRKVPDAQRPLEHQGQVIGREALVGACVEDGQRRIVGGNHAYRQRLPCIQPLPGSFIEPGTHRCRRTPIRQDGFGFDRQRLQSDQQQAKDRGQQRPCQHVESTMAKFSGRIEGMASAPRACGHIGNDAAMLAGRWILFPGTHACRHSL